MIDCGDDDDDDVWERRFHFFSWGIGHDGLNYESLYLVDEAKDWKFLFDWFCFEELNEKKQRGKRKEKFGSFFILPKLYP